MAAISQKIMCHEASLRSPPPARGPAIGATAIMTMRVESILAAWVEP